MMTQRNLLQILSIMKTVTPLSVNQFQPQILQSTSNKVQNAAMTVKNFTLLKQMNPRLIILQHLT